MVENRRFMRTKLLLGDEGLEKLRESSVMVVGLGAVGGFALEALARSGIGHLVLVDFDIFEESNINRQILALSSTIGQKKTEAAAARVREINPDCKVDVKDMFVSADNLDALFAEKPDFVVDAIDALNPKCCLIEYLVQAEIPFISSMGAALKTNPAFIKTGKLSQSKNCGLAKFIRKRLRRRGLDISQISCVYSDEQASLPEGALVQPEEEAAAGQGRARCTMGSLPTITAIFGLTAAHAAIMEIIKQ